MPPLRPDHKFRHTYKGVYDRRASARDPGPESRRRRDGAGDIA